MEYHCASSPHSSSNIKSFFFITWRKRSLPGDVPQRTESNTIPLPIQLQPSRLYDVKLILDVTQRGPETWFRTQQCFQRCSKSYCWTKTTYRNGPWSISQSFQVDFTRTCWPLLLKRKEQNTPIKEGRRDPFLLNPFSVKAELALWICIQVVLLLLSSNGKPIEKDRDKQYEQPLWLHRRATYQAPSNILRWTPWILAHLKQDVKESRLLDILLYLRRAAEGCMSEKHRTKESYLVFSNWLSHLTFLFFQYSSTEPSWLNYRKHELNAPCFSMVTRLQIFQRLGGIYNFQSCMARRDETEQIFLQRNY